MSCVAADVEDISRKTGNFKRFAVFVKMLVSALEQSSDAVFLDLLTYADLVSLRGPVWYYS
jgi:coiled-coil domain-containing protein 61